ncbi:type II toxin-antitoxin system VapC family toxin [Shinella sp. BYT-45]|uniref:type II toxin-antitoxin system VapC family toxin n=1 Tax=Shinella sp. BYT-45 TaxID=3377377 RepID=UPI00398039CB
MTTFRYMLDTNVISDIVRNPDGAAARRVATINDDALCTSAIVASELRYGLRKKGAVALARRVEAVLGEVEILPYDAPVSFAYAQTRSTLEKSGQPIGYTDLFIAAHALSLDLTLVTANVREFSRVEGLKVENWLEARP